MDIRLYSVSEACERLGIGRTSLYSLATSGDIVLRKIGGRTVISESALRDFVEGLPIAQTAIGSKGPRHR